MRAALVLASAVIVTLSTADCGVTEPRSVLAVDGGRNADGRGAHDAGRNAPGPSTDAMANLHADAHADARASLHADDGGGADAGSSLNCLSNSWPYCTFMSACDGCCVDGTCLPRGASCGKGLGLCTGPSCSGVGALGEPCATGQAYVGVGITGDDPNAECLYEPWTGCTTTSAICGDAGVCVPCGVAGEPCCEYIQIFCADGTYCKDQKVCDSECGKAGEPCCNGAWPVACTDGGVCISYPFPASYFDGTCVPGASCGADAGRCTTCGNVGQACCGDGGCDEGRCTSGMCQEPPPHP